MKKRTYTESDLIAALRDLEAAYGTGAEAYLSVDAGRVTVGVFSLSVEINRETIFRSFNNSISDLFDKAYARIPTIIRPDDAWAIIGAEAA